MHCRLHWQPVPAYKSISGAHGALHSSAITMQPSRLFLFLMSGASWGSCHDNPRPVGDQPDENMTAEWRPWIVACPLSLHTLPDDQLSVMLSVSIILNLWHLISSSGLQRAAAWICSYADVYSWIPFSVYGKSAKVSSNRTRIHACTSTTLLNGSWPKKLIRKSTYCVYQYQKSNFLFFNIFF